MDILGKHYVKGIKNRGCHKTGYAIIYTLSKHE
jgi:hypothetical protein